VKVSFQRLGEKGVKRNFKKAKSESQQRMGEKGNLSPKKGERKKSVTIIGLDNENFTQTTRNKILGA